MSQNNRKEALTSWLAKTTETEGIELLEMSGDAGFRKYYRALTKTQQSIIVVDSPKDKCNNAGFIAIQQGLSEQGIVTPEIIAVDREQGFFCLSDLGHSLLSDKLNSDTVEHYYKQALALIPQIAHTNIAHGHANVAEQYQLPIFDRSFIQLELNIFTEWLVKEYLQLEGINVSKLQACFDLLIDNALEQPQVTMHRDFHSRNIMAQDNGELAVIDFQDAVVGPVMYDVVSLLRDCYVKWPDEQVYSLLNYFMTEYAQERYQLFNIECSTWQRWFDLMGLQRHVKAAGIFARLYLRDGKAGYLPDIPLTLSYIEQVSAKYDELSYLREIVSERIMPALACKL